MRLDELYKNETRRQALEAMMELGAVSEFDLRMLEFLDSIYGKGGLPEEYIKVYAIYLSFLEDGSTRLPLDETGIDRWNGKLSKLMDAREKEQEDGTIDLSEEDKARCALLNEYLSDISDAFGKVKGDGAPEPMTVQNGCLYSHRAFDDSTVIMDRFKAIFSTKPESVPDEDVQAVIEKYEGEGITLDPLQAKAICKGRQGSLIITGGPGTGKTTIVSYLLKELEEDGNSLKVYLAAPSGKAADRLRESICESRKIKDLPEGWESMTIHRLLGYNGDGEFIFNASNRFKDGSVFVIDEASMIDLDLFAHLLEAIPDDSRVYLLGDKDQLPSVDAGAVLGEVLATAPREFIVELEKSQRFRPDTPVGRLALAMQKGSEKDVKEIVSDDTWMPFDKLPAAIEAPDSEANLALFRYPESSDGKRLARARKQEALESAIKPWVRRFCKGNVEDILKLSRQARILCTEYDGVFGVDNINLTIRKLLGHGSKQGTFEGEQVMIVKNMTVLNLFNGDSGIIAERDGELCFVKDDGESVPFRLIPSDCIVTAYASTIHKAQGSGYDNVLLFLPENKRSLLATRQIAYTGITRVKGGTLYIVGSSDRFDACYANPTIRDTGIDLSQQHS